MYTIDAEIEEYVPLAPLTTLEVGGPARYLLRARSRQAVQAALAFAREQALPLLVLGHGSNLLVADEGFPGLVLRIDLRGLRVQVADGVVEVAAGAGENWHALVNHTVVQGWAGLECLAGIPGTVGATPIQNVGAYGQEVADTISAVEALDTTTGDTVRFSNAECGFGYRNSRFKRLDRGRYIVLVVHFRLQQGGRPDLRYVELERFLHAQGITRPSLAQVRQAVMDIRRGKSMVRDGQDPNRRSAGSFFVNPVVTEAELAMIEARKTQYAAYALRLPRFPQADGRYKVPAAWLIERAGFTRGYTRGHVGISTNHTLSLVNRGDATAREIIALAREIRNRVEDIFAIRLEPEPTFIGITMDEG